jgi:uncharacterized membrane protein
MALSPRIKNPLILSIVATVFLVPVLILSRYIFRSQLSCVPGGIVWAIISVTTVIYFIIIFLVFLYYSSLGRK